MEREVVQYVLPYPFLWLQYHEFFTDNIKNTELIFGIFNPKVELWKIKGFHRPKVGIFLWKK